MKHVKINGKEYKLVYPPWADIRMSPYNKALGKIAKAESIDEEKARDAIGEKTKKFWKSVILHYLLLKTGTWQW